jgi:hypothetical protein
MRNALLLVRFTSLLLVWLGLLLLLRNILLSYESFRPSYIGFYFRQELLSPSLILIAGLLMRLRAKSISRTLTKDVED